MKTYNFLLEIQHEPYPFYDLPYDVTDEEAEILQNAMDDDAYELSSVSELEDLYAKVDYEAGLAIEDYIDDLREELGDDELEPENIEYEVVLGEFVK